MDRGIVKCKGMLSISAFAAKSIADSRHYIKASAALQSLSSYSSLPFHSPSARQNNTLFLFLLSEFISYHLWKVFFVCFSFDKCSPHHQWNRNKIKNTRFHVLGLQFKSSLILEGLGRGRSWCMDVHNILGEEVKRKMPFFNAKGRNNSERNWKTVQMLHYIHNDM